MACRHALCSTFSHEKPLSELNLAGEFVMNLLFWNGQAFEDPALKTDWQVQGGSDWLEAASPMAQEGRD